MQCNNSFIANCSLLFDGSFFTASFKVKHLNDGVHFLVRRICGGTQ